ncbi:probable inactive ATP-dependent zinc metalloprotease FTSHI 2, chloroplastic [Tanacetum coccineum]|uniref:Probable inactive ATP-dependent zinc metalloprotease FTSHI 2, chloroplastic n=1 Tax=Tanacetum coccineum TaxID=301880 RepID=A0ABQ4Y547_9ASTR
MMCQQPRVKRNEEPGRETTFVDGCRGNVITIASTNRPDILDPALLIEKSSYLIQVHARKKPKTEDVDYAAVAAMTDRMVGAELVNILEVAVIHDA